MITAKASRLTLTLTEYGKVSRNGERMANLRGVMQPNGKEGVSRLASRDITTRLNTHEGYVETTLHADGRFSVRLNGELKASGHVGNGTEAFLEVA